MSKRKAIAFTAFLTTLLILATIIPIFLVKAEARNRNRHRHHPRHPSPLGKSIEVTFVYGDGTPIVGLSVKLQDGIGFPVQTDITDSAGEVQFTNLEDETYTWKWSWQGVDYSHSELIDCSKIVWEFTETLPYWTIEKTFTYADGSAIVGLDVIFDGIITIPTDPSGMVSFVDVKAGDHTLSWSWQTVSASEDFIIGFETPSPVEKTDTLPYWAVEKTFTYPDGTPIVGLDVTLNGMADTTDESGTVYFEVKAGTYTLGWSWQAVPDSHGPFTILFDTPSPVELGINELSYWTIDKTFYYEGTTDPVPDGLAVELKDSVGTVIDTQTTSSGKVTFVNLKAGDYTLQWVWGGASYSEPVSIDFSTPSPWTKTNELPLKSGGGTTLG